MNVITYTNLANDEKAKLLLFPFLSGTQLALCAWCRPFTNSQAEILDFVDPEPDFQCCEFFPSDYVRLYRDRDRIGIWG